MPALVRLDDPDTDIVGTSESMLVTYPIAPSFNAETSAWSWTYTGGTPKEYDETAQILKDEATGEHLFTDAHGNDVPLSGVGVRLPDGRVVPLATNAPPKPDDATVIRNALGLS